MTTASHPPWRFRPNLSFPGAWISILQLCISKTCQQTAIDVDDLTIDERGSVRSEEHRGPNELAGFSPASRRRAAGDVTVERGVHRQRIGHRGSDIAGR